MPYVEREGGVIVGLYALAQVGRAEELLADDNAEVVAFLTPSAVKRVERVGAVRFTVAAGVVTTTNDTIGISSIGRLTAGRFRLFYANPDAAVSYLPDTPVLRDAADVHARISARTATYTEIKCTNLTGVAVDPAEVIVKFDKVS